MIALTLDELLSYTEEEREKWRTWLRAQPAALDITLQPDGRFPTVGALIDHIFLVEARHLARLRNEPVPDASGVAPGNVDGLFNYGSDARQALRAYAASVGRDDVGTVREFTVQSGTVRLTPRKLLMHIGLHETRHWAQIALGIRQAGLAPPGNHDLFYSRALE
jgi:uncharacterized damage-inducible protein DinB